MPFIAVKSSLGFSFTHSPPCLDVLFWIFKYQSVNYDLAPATRLNRPLGSTKEDLSLIYTGDL
jgi:hypothetical protein